MVLDFLASRLQNLNVVFRFGHGLGNDNDCTNLAIPMAPAKLLIAPTETGSSNSRSTQRASPGLRVMALQFQQK